MFVMPINIAQQLTADRRAAYEDVAARHRLHRLVSRRPGADGVLAASRPRAAVIAAPRRVASAEAVGVCKVA
jgi:hypothetical protein